MRGILLAKFTTFIRNPWVFLLFTVMSIGFTLIIGYTGGNGEKITVPVAGAEEVRTGSIGKALEGNEVYHFKWQEEADMKEIVRLGEAEAGIIMEEAGYEMFIRVETPNVQLIEQTIADIYMEKIRESQVLELFQGETAAEEKAFLTAYHEAMDQPLFEITNDNFRNADSYQFDQGLHAIFGFTLFFVIYTIGYNVLPILTEKKEGIWDRMILSPLKKWEIYLANLVYSFFEGYLQIIIIFSVFHYFVGVDFYGELAGILLIMLAYTFTIVSLGIFVTALVKNIQQFNAVLPIISVSMAMIAGAFWPLEVVQSDILLALSKINPLTYGMEALNNLVLYNLPFEEILMPVSILILMGVIFMGVGIHLMEKRHI
ncbi:ABC transporter permease [Oceanobacillus alkalisoli]|uniref:ABC transporter permease n=1 Tax=Oceanobacillus alkalisoli TaxID=2925113 RepID=UPI001EE41CD6|nr:ABC transporter permease [Oceanobacillus alkalisoli]MCG5102061.1 ABC transporter permease [Oceanobacillus alkalisoli]